MREETITALEMRKKFGGVLDRVAKKGHHVTIMRSNRPLATIIPANEHEQACSNQPRKVRIEKLLGEIRQWQKTNSRKLQKGLVKDAAEVIREMRDERSQHLVDLFK